MVAGIQNNRDKKYGRNVTVLLRYKIMKQHKNLNTKLNILEADVTPKASLIGLGGFHFSNQISAKYIIFRKSTNLPALIFLRLFATGIVNEITNINHMEFINNYFRLQLSFYLKMINHAFNHYLYPLLSSKISNYAMQSLLHGKVQGSKGITQSAKKASTAKIALLSLAIAGREAKKGDEGRLLGLQKRISEIALLKHSLHNKTKLLSNRNPAMLEDRNLKAAKMYPDNVKLKLLPHEAHMSLWHVKGSKNLLPSHETSAQDASLPTPQDRGSKWNSYHQGKGDNIKFPLPLWERVRVRGREVFPEQKQLDVFLKKMTHKYLPSNLLETTLLTGSRYKSTLPDMIYSLPGENLLSKRPKALRGEPSELIFRKPTMQSNDTVLENKQDLLTEKRISLKTNNDMAKDFLKKIPMPDINSIADKVYKIIERKIDIEKDRRGL